MTHTPSPWHIGMRPGPIIYGPQGEQVVDMFDMLLEPDEHKANARLIATAPELLLAVQYLLTIINRNEPRLNGMMEVNFARAAVAKALGET